MNPNKNLFTSFSLENEDFVAFFKRENNNAVVRKQNRFRCHLKGS